MLTEKSAVRLEHEQAACARVTLIDWRFGNACNYACSYCPVNLHDGSLGWQAYDTITAFCDRLVTHYEARGQKIFLQFSGGEPTVYRRFLDLLTHLKARDCRVGLISNGSRTLAWWEQAAPLLDQAVLTHHIEYVQLDHFIRVAQRLARNMRTHVNVTMLPARFEKCLANAHHLAQECADITLTLKPLLVDFRAEMYPYTAGQKEVLARTEFAIQRTRPLRDAEEARGKMRLLYVDNTAQICKPSQLIVGQQNRWAGWQCHAGLELLAIDAQGDVWRGTCKQGGRLGHIADETFAFPEAPVCCQKAVCHCATDIMTTKSKN